ncbi:MAG: TraR/DksA family transcriptional regulator [Thermodesulfovibrionales bacterium]
MAAVKKAAPKKKIRPAAAPAKKPVKPASAPAKKKAAPKSAEKPKSKRPAAVKPAPAKKKAVAAQKPAAAKKPVKPAKDRMKELKAVLLKRKEAIVKEAKEEIAKYVSGDNRQLVDTAVDEGDWAVVDISEDINLMRLDAHRKHMLEIDEALRKIREGTYGICEECGEEISEKRLSVMPAATLCISCKENKEQIEAVGREESE